MEPAMEVLIHRPSAAALQRAMMRRRALAASGHGMMPAVRVEAGDDNPKKRSRTEAKTTTTTCSICLEDIDACGTSMPCSHVFHEGCIVKWLRQSHYCPLCRFQIPTESTRIATELY